jgi:hypothetical protein
LADFVDEGFVAKSYRSALALAMADHRRQVDVYKLARPVDRA